MRRKSALLLALAAGLIIAALFLLAPGTAMPTRKKIRLPDGNIVTVQKVTYSPGSQHDFSFDDSALSRFGRKLPRFLRRYFPSPGGMRWNTTSNSLVLWFTMADGKTGAPLDFHGRLSAEVVDEHGCSSSDETYGTMSSGSDPTVYITTFAQFPRRQPRFLVRLRERPGRTAPPVPAGLSAAVELKKVVAEFELPNPSRGPFPVWTPESLPAARTNAEMVFILKDTGNPRPGPAWRSLQFDILRDGRVVQDWEQGEIFIGESTGNRGHAPFCTNEPAWKLEVEFLRNVKAAFLSTEMFTITNLVVPAAGEAVLLTNTFSLQGRQFEACALAGPGRYVYSNTVLTIAEPSRAGQGESSHTSSSYQGVTPIYQLDVRCKEPHVALAVPRFANDERLMVRARFPNGVAYKLPTGPSTVALWLFTFSGVTNMGPFDLDVIIHTVRQAEFLVKPPSK